MLLAHFEVRRDCKNLEVLKDRLLNWLQEKVEQVEDNGDEASPALAPGYALHFAYAGVENESGCD